MESLSVFDMLKIGVGPSSSHTLGPWRAVQRWLNEDLVELRPERIEIRLYGSLALTGRGHGTDVAIMLALLGEDPVTVAIDGIPAMTEALRRDKQLTLHGQRLAFDPDRDIVFNAGEQLPQHPNGLICRAETEAEAHERQYYSVGGGFVLAEGEAMGDGDMFALPYPAQSPAELLVHCDRSGHDISEVVRANERAWRDDAAIDAGLDQLWAVMLEGLYHGCHASGELPGGLRVLKRAPTLNARLLPGDTAADAAAWLAAICTRRYHFDQVMQWISAFALAINEENASIGRVVTAPTNGAAGVIPAVLMYHLCFEAPGCVHADRVRRFLLVAAEIGTHFKKGATISAAAGGCQAEIGVSSAMAAAALAELQGGSVRQAFMAAEIAMEHHLGMTCDPVGGLVQVPCIERNAMGAVKAINAAQLALASDPDKAKVSLDQVIRTMAETAHGMSDRYKETSLGGLAVNIGVNVTEC